MLKNFHTNGHTVRKIAEVLLDARQMPEIKIVKHGEWRSSKHLAAFEDTMCMHIRKYGRQLSEKSWCVPHNSHDRYAVAVKTEDVLYLPLYYIVLTNFVWISLYFIDTYLLYWPCFIIALFSNLRDFPISKGDRLRR